jgi:hypothetical protein
MGVRPGTKWFFLFRVKSSAMSASHGTPDPSVVPASLRSVTRYAMNPLIVPREVRSKKKTVRILGKGLIPDMTTGEVVAEHGIFVSKQVDEGTFVKLFDEGIKAAFDLTGPGFKVFQLVLKLVATGKMQDDKISLHISSATDPTSSLRMSDKTFWRGLRELISKQFIAASTVPTFFWINPHLFFKGDRLTIVNEYVRANNTKETEPKQVAPEHVLALPLTGDGIV